MVKKLPVPLAQVKAGDAAEYLHNEIYQIIYSLYRAEKVLRKYITI